MKAETGTTQQLQRGRKTYPAHAVKGLRVNQGLTALHVAQRAGLSQARLSRVECNLVVPTPDEIAAIERAIGELAMEAIQADAAGVDGVK